MLDQGDGDWTQRQRRLFREAGERGERRTVLIGSDSPHVGYDAVERALALLDEHDVVLGPTFDGGYYLIAMRGFHDVLDGVVMSTAGVAAAVGRRAARIGASLAHVAATFDVDEAADLDALRCEVAARGDLPATRAALARLSRTRGAAGRPRA